MGLVFRDTDLRQSLLLILDTNHWPFPILHVYTTRDITAAYMMTTSYIFSNWYSLLPRCYPYQDIVISYYVLQWQMCYLVTTKPFEIFDRAVLRRKQRRKSLGPSQENRIGTIAKDPRFCLLSNTENFIFLLCQTK